jgi:hypothetical protein
VAATLRRQWQRNGGVGKATAEAVGSVAVAGSAAVEDTVLARLSAVAIAHQRSSGGDGSGSATAAAAR